jgi:hypothetical protein
MSDRDEKDRLGDTLQKRERGEEERYFAEQDRIRLAKLRAQTGAAAPSGQSACPRCGAALQARHVRGVAVDECTSGCGVWLDRGELEQLGGATSDRGAFLTTLLTEFGLLGKP